jgi:predicted ATPase with chaperone activity
MNNSNALQNDTKPAGLERLDPALSVGLTARIVDRDTSTNIPSAPLSIEDTGLSESYVTDLIIKHLYRYGTLNGREIATYICLPLSIIDVLLDEIVLQTYVEKRGGKGLGHATDRYALTERGKQQARDIMQVDTYIGPAPITLNDYSLYVKSHNLQTVPVNESYLREAWKNFILDDDLFAQIGPAICSGKSCFLYGPPGTGKTTIAKAVAKFLDQYGGKVAIPHAILIGGSIIRVFDPVYHQPAKEENHSAEDSVWLANRDIDHRWVLCNRPTVIVGGELTLDMLDLRYNPTTRYYEAPLQVKSNGGVFVIDDFGRQMVQPTDLLNRWIVPLEERIDYLTLHTGKKFSMPFEQLVAFATNLDPKELADDAFLRRIRYKIYIGEPSIEAYKCIFQRECEKKELVYLEEDLDKIIDKYYRQKDHPLRACDPRDVTDWVSDYCQFTNASRVLDWETLDHIYHGYMQEIKSGNYSPLKTK